MFYSLFLFGIFIGYLNTFPLEIVGGDLNSMSTYTMGGLVACVRVRMMGEGGQIFVILVRTYYLNDP